MPDVTGVHIPRALNNVSIYYRNPAYIADAFSPPVGVAKRSDKYFVYGLEHFRLAPSLRAPKAETSEITYSLSTDQYYCDRFGYHELIEDPERENSDEALRPDIDTTEHITECLMLDREYRVANSILDSTNPDWGPYNATHFVNLAGEFSDTAGADPRSRFYAAKSMIFKDSRRMPNKVEIPVEVSLQLSIVDQVDELRKYTDPGLMTNSGLPPSLWGLQVYEAQASYNAAVEGDAESFDEVWGNNIVVSYTAPTVGLRTLTFSVTFQQKPFQVKKWREEKRESDVIEINHTYDNKIIAPATGYVMLNAIR